MNRNSTKTSKSLRFWSGFAILVVLLAGMASSANAQLATTTATLSGVVSDPTGAIVPKAAVTLSSTQNGVSRTFATDATGRYLFGELPPSAYTLTIKAGGFKEYQQSGIVLNAGETATQDVALAVGSESESVTVTADASLLNTDNSNVSANLDEKQLVELPSSTRNAFGFLTLNSSVNNSSEQEMLLGGGSNTTDDADQDITFLNFAGGFFGTTMFELDGSVDTDSEWGGAIYSPSLDAIQEMRVQNMSFSAQYGFSTGNVVDVITKSGTNAFHGDAWDFYQNQDLNAIPYFSRTPNGSLSREEAGAAAGGPLYIPGVYRQREKTFIWGLFDYLTISTPTVDTYSVPDANFRNGNFSEILGSTQLGTDALGRPIYQGQIYDPRSGHAITAGQPDTKTPGNPYGTNLIATQTGYIRNPIPGNILSNIVAPSIYVPDPVGSKLLGYYPTAKGSGLANNLVVDGTAPAQWKEYNARVDHNFNANSRAYFRYAYKQEFKTGNAPDWGNDPAGPGNLRPNNRWGMWAGYSQVFSPTFTMNLTSGVQIWHETSNNQSFGFKASSIGLPAYIDQNSPLFPMVNVGGESPLGPGANDQQSVTNHGPIGTVNADFIKLAGKHTLNFGWTGVEQVFGAHPYFQTTLNFTGGFTSGPNPLVGSGFASGNGVADLLLGTVDPGTVAGYSNAPYESNHLFAEYIQDDWKPTRQLTLNLGFRYDIDTPWTFRHNEGSSFNPYAVNPISYVVGAPYLGALQFLAPGNRYAYNPNWDNFAPRVGFSYQPIQKAVIHGGFGIFYPEPLTSSGAVDADGFSASTQANTSLNDGVTPNPNISVANPWGGVYAQQTGNANGEFQQIGNSVGGGFRFRPSPYVEQWMLGVQYEFTPSDELSVNYIANRGVRMIGSYNADQLNPSYLLSQGSTALNAQVANPLGTALTNLTAGSGGKIAPSSCSGYSLDAATVPQAALLTPFPEYCVAGAGQLDAPVGQSLYNALQVTYNHRVSKGLTALVSYTYSKFLDNVEGNNGWSYNGPTNWGVTPANNYNLAADKSVDAGDIPQALVASYTYQLPVGRNRAFGANMGRAADAVVGGWEISGDATFRAGIPLGIFGNDQNTWGGNPRPDVIGNVHASHATNQEWFNTAAFAFAPYGSFGNAPRFFSNLRGPHYQNWDTVLDKNFYFKEQMRFQFRLETYNTFNHPDFYAPEAGSTSWGGCDPNGTTGCASSFGTITNTFPPRSVQWAGKFYW